ncbi:membrane protein [Streptomyces kurssanovii]|nr:membrane protein [Streptomyces kurssanovii]
MGIESDQLVYDYLSRVGDLAQQAQLPSGERMRLVTTLRTEIDKQRTKFGGDSPAGVRRILGRLGTPDEVVASATSTPAASAGSRDAEGSRPTPRQAGPVAGDMEPEASAPPRPRGRRRVPRPRAGDAPTSTPSPLPREAASPPHLAGMDELGPSGSEPDWWRIDPAPFGPGDAVAGFVGGVEIPEILRPPPSEDENEDESGDEPEGEDAGAGGQRRSLRRLLRRRAGADAAPAPAAGARTGLGSPMLLLAAALLVAGAVLGSLVALGLGWLLAYGSRRLSRTEVKFAVLGLPGAAVAGGALWLWGRINRHWGEEIPEDGMRDALTGTWPWVVRGAAVASAVFLAWRSRRLR